MRARERVCARMCACLYVCLSVCVAHPQSLGIIHKEPESQYPMSYGGQDFQVSIHQKAEQGEEEEEEEQEEQEEEQEEEEEERS